MGITRVLQAKLFANSCFSKKAVPFLYIQTNLLLHVPVQTIRKTGFKMSPVKKNMPHTFFFLTN